MRPNTQPALASPFATSAMIDVTASVPSSGPPHWAAWLTRMSPLATNSSIVASGTRRSCSVSARRSTRPAASSRALATASSRVRPERRSRLTASVTVIVECSLSSGVGSQVHQQLDRLAVVEAWVRAQLVLPGNALDPAFDRVPTGGHVVDHGVELTVVRERRHDLELAHHRVGG